MEVGVVMVKQGQHWRLTKHGRARFIERVGMMPDIDIVNTAREGLVMGFFTGFSYKWADDYKRRRDKRLITVYFDVDGDLWDAYYALMDRESPFSFSFSQFKRRW